MKRVVCLIILLLAAIPFGATAEDVGVTNEVITLWPEGNMPATTIYTEDTNAQYFDPPGFQPNMVYFPALEGTDIKGAVLLCAGGAFAFRGNEGDSYPTAEYFNSLGYQCFVVNYRLQPYTMQEGALDLARAVRYVRSNAAQYGIKEADIAVIGFSAGGILCGELALNFDGLTNGTAIDSSYVPDELDTISADAGAVGMVYSFYGRLSVASTDVEKFAASDLPPTRFVYGSEETFRGQIEACAEAVEEAGVVVESQMLDGLRHGFGAANGQWVRDFDSWLAEVWE